MDYIDGNGHEERASLVRCIITIRWFYDSGRLFGHWIDGLIDGFGFTNARMTFSGMIGWLCLFLERTKKQGSYIPPSSYILSLSSFPHCFDLIDPTDSTLMSCFVAAFFITFCFDNRLVNLGRHSNTSIVTIIHDKQSHGFRKVRGALFYFDPKKVKA